MKAGTWSLLQNAGRASNDGDEPSQLLPPIKRTWEIHSPSLSKIGAGCESCHGGCIGLCLQHTWEGNITESPLILREPTL